MFHGNDGNNGAPIHTSLSNSRSKSGYLPHLQAFPNSHDFKIREIRQCRCYIIFVQLFGLFNRAKRIPPHIFPVLNFSTAQFFPRFSSTTFHIFRNNCLTATFPAAVVLIVLLVTPTDPARPPGQTGMHELEPDCVRLSPITLKPRKVRLHPLPTLCLPFAYPLPTLCIPFAYPLLTLCLASAYRLLTVARGSCRCRSFSSRCVARTPRVSAG